MMTTSVGAFLMADIAHDAGIPAGVLNVVQGIGETAGDALVNNPDLDRISFTGSTDTAIIIGQAAARSITPFSAELGGKSDANKNNSEELELF